MYRKLKSTIDASLLKFEGKLLIMNEYYIRENLLK